ncbi:MAG: glycosyltransferase [Lachnospiraceae bacterium]|nr:glycosyltransferase [Lachnospiraceae bacterium]
MCNKVSIIIPVYNGENFLEQAIDSALSQTYKNVEVIVVDDGSTDKTPKICNRYGRYIRYYRKNNGGVASAVNYGIREMNGDFFSWLSHDDAYYPDKIKIQMEAMESHSECDIINGNFSIENIIYHSNTITQFEKTYSKELMETSVFPLLVTSFHGCVPLVKRSVFHDVGTFNENLLLTQDYDFFFRAMKNKKTVFLEKPLVTVRIHDRAGRITNKDFSKDCAKQYMYFCDSLSDSEIRKMFPEPSVFYYRTLAMIRARGDYDDAKTFINTHNIISKNEYYDFKDILNKLAIYPFDNVYIYGIGLQGKVLSQELIGRKVRVSAFVDNNISKVGQSFDNIPCISKENLIKKNGYEKILVIVSPEDNSDILINLNIMGIKNVLTKNDLEKFFLQYPPIDMEALNEMAS